MRKHLAMTAVAVTTFLAIAVPAVAQDVSGVWEASFEGRGARTLAITLAQDGMYLTGSAQMPRGEGIVSEGMIHGNEVMFTLSAGGGLLTLELKGTVDGDTMTGTLTSPRGEVPWTAKRKKEN